MDRSIIRALTSSMLPSPRARKHIMSATLAKGGFLDGRSVSSLLLPATTRGLAPPSPEEWDVVAVGAGEPIEDAAEALRLLPALGRGSRETSESTNSATSSSLMTSEMPSHASTR